LEIQLLSIQKVLRKAMIRLKAIHQKEACVGEVFYVTTVIAVVTGWPAE